MRLGWSVEVMDAWHLVGRVQDSYTDELRMKTSDSEAGGKGLALPQNEAPLCSFLSQGHLTMFL